MRFIFAYFSTFVENSPLPRPAPAADGEIFLPWGRFSLPGKHQRPRDFFLPEPLTNFQYLHFKAFSWEKDTGANEGTPEVHALSRADTEVRPYGKSRWLL